MDYSNSMLGAAQAGKAQVSATEISQIQAATSVMEEEAKRLRAITDHLSDRLNAVLVPAPPQNSAQGPGPIPQVSLCPLADTLKAQVHHFMGTRSILEDILSRIQL